MDNTADLLQIKIESAKKQLSEETLKAIAAVPWQAAILQMRETKGYTFEQLGDLEIETELLLCGLLTPENYPKELENRMKITKIQANDLVNEMNKQVFSKIKENLIKSTNSAKAVPVENKIDAEKEEKSNTQILNSAGIEIISPRLVEEGAGGGDLKENHLAFGTPPSKGGEEPTPPILAQKLSGYVKNEVKETDHSLNNLTPSNPPSAVPNKPKIDPYREIPE